MTALTLITGANRGLGRAMAEAVAQSGGDLIVAYRGNAAQAAEVVTRARGLGRKALAVQLDVARPETFAAFAVTLRAALHDHFGRDSLDNLVNNAGHGTHAALEATTPAEFDALFDVHVKGPFFLVQALLPLIANGGQVVNISTGLTRMTFPGYGAYAAAKGAVEVLTRYMAKEFGARGITVNAIAPGAIETDFGGGAVRDNAGLNAQIAGVTALGRVGLPSDIGPMIARFLDPANGWVTGQRIEVSGGQLV